MIKVSEDQNEIEINGVVYKFIVGETYKPCDGCVLENVICSCRQIPCAANERKDRERKILKLKQQ